MVQKGITGDGVESLLAELRSRRRLPRTDERREVRQRAGATQRQVAEAIGVSTMAVHRWERGSDPRDPARRDAYRRLLDELRQLGEVNR